MAAPDADDADFRSALYARYASGFKGDLDDDPRFEAWLFAYASHCYLPLLAGVPRDARVLELGCGQGHLLGWLRSVGFTNAEGIDTSAEMVALATRRGVAARVGDVLGTLSASVAGWDVVIAIDVVEHFTRSELLRVLPAAHAALRPGGRLILRTPNGQGLFAGRNVYGDLTHLTILTPDSARQLLVACGFGDVRCTESGPVPRGLSGRARVLAWATLKRVLNIVRAIEGGRGMAQDVWTDNVIVSARRP